MKKMLKGILLKPEKEPEIIEIEDTLENLQKLVEGRIEVLSIRTDVDKMRSIDLIFNEECKFLFEDANKFIVYPSGLYDYLSGNIFVCAADEETGEFVSLSEEEIEYYQYFLMDDYLFI